MIVIGHRGAAGHKLENSRESFLFALELGVSAIECDVQLVGETFYLFHDRNTDRVANKAIDLREASECVISSCTLKNGEPPLTLDQALDLVRGKALLNIEIKSPSSGEKLARYLFKRFHDVGEQAVIVSSFSELELLAFSTVAPNIPMAVLIYGTRVQWDFKWCPGKISAINISYDFLTPALSNSLKSLGYKIMCYTVNSPTEIESCQRLGIDGIFTDFPDVGLAVLGKKSGNGLKFL